MISFFCTVNSITAGGISYHSKMLLVVEYFPELLNADSLLDPNRIGLTIVLTLRCFDS